MTWDVTVACSTAESHIDLAMQGPGCVAEMAAWRKEATYATLQTQFDFQPIAVETLGSINESVTSFYRATRKRGLCCRLESACPSVTSVYCIQMAEDIVKLLCRPDVATSF